MHMGHLEGLVGRRGFTHLTPSSCYWISVLLMNCGKQKPRSVISVAEHLRPKVICQIIILPSDPRPRVYEDLNWEGLPVQEGHMVAEQQGPGSIPSFCVEFPRPPVSPPLKHISGQTQVLMGSCLVRRTSHL